MIGSIRGRILEISAASVLVEAGGLGYRVVAAPSLVARFKTGQEAFLYTHDHIREDAHVLYGFAAKEDLELFESLIGISGVGPKVAMTVLAVGDAGTVRAAIMAGNLDLLTSVPGVGKKTAQKIILELKGQLVEAESSSGADADMIDALVGLGYSANQARETLKHVTAQDPGERIKEALKMLAK